MTTLTRPQKDAIKALVFARTNARLAIATQRRLREVAKDLKAQHDAAAGDAKRQAVIKFDMDQCNEHLLEVEFEIVRVGYEAKAACHQIKDTAVPREDWLRALSVNESEWHTPEMLEHGDDPLKVIYVFNFENSATKMDEYDRQPLCWCVQMAMFHAADTVPAIGKAVHEVCNATMDGAFGEYQAPTTLERLGVRA